MRKHLLRKIKTSVVSYARNLKTQIRLTKLRKSKKIQIMDAKETVEHISNNNLSVARFGDGEFNLVFNKQGINFQRGNSELSERLKQVLVSKQDNVLVCIPYAINSVRGLNEHAANFYFRWALGNYERLALLLREHEKQEYYFGDTNITRPYKDWENAKHAKYIFPQLKKMWEGRCLLVVEGCKTRLGVGNDLFSGAISVKRVLAPAENAYDCYDEIKMAVLKHYSDELVLLALGPTATVLACDLAQCGIQALDVGHIDIEYEWFLRGAKSKIAIPGKYTNEAVGGNSVAECDDVAYLSEIVANIGCESNR